MNIDPIILNSIIFLGACGLIFGIGLGFAAKKFSVQSDPREEEILSLLPGVNCGACGFAGCSGYASALTAGTAKPGRCTVASQEANANIAAVLGVRSEKNDRKAAIIFCDGGKNCKDRMVYTGIKDCALASKVFGGNKECSWGCLGFGNCIKACKFGAMSQTKEGEVPKIDIKKCVACGKCVEACPRALIHLVPCKFQYHVLCSSQDKGADVKKACSAGCIGCGVCAKVCQVKDITIENNLAYMKYDKCTNCGHCLRKCPVTGVSSKIYTKKG